MKKISKRTGGGYRLNRLIIELIESAGFRIERLGMGYMRGLKPMAIIFEGDA